MGTAVLPGSVGSPDSSQGCWVLRPLGKGGLGMQESQLRPDVWRRDPLCRDAGSCLLGETARLVRNTS